MAHGSVSRDQQHLGTCWICKCPDPPPDLPGVEPSGGSTRPPEDAQASKAGLLSPGRVDALGCIVLCGECCPVHCGTFSSIPELHPLGAKSILATVTRNVPRRCRTSPGGQITPS